MRCMALCRAHPSSKSIQILEFSMTNITSLSNPKSMPEIIDLEETLTPDELLRFQHLDAIVEKGLLKVFEVGHAFTRFATESFSAKSSGLLKNTCSASTISVRRTHTGLLRRQMLSPFCRPWATFCPQASGNAGPSRNTLTIKYRKFGRT